MLHQKPQLYLQSHVRVVRPESREKQQNSIIALCLIYFFMSIMFPVNFALGLRNLGNHTKRASSFLVMAIVGGAIFPALMGYIADISTMQIGFVIPLICFIVVFLFGITGYKIKKA